MAEPKPIASLSSGLLARKGAAKPAMRRQGLGQGMGGPMPQILPQDDLGWDDMGYDVDPPHDAPLHDEGVPHYGNLLAGAIPDTIPAEPEDEPYDHRASAAPAPVVPDVVRQQATIAERMAEPAPQEAAVPQPAEAQTVEVQPPAVQPPAVPQAQVPPPQAALLEPEIEVPQVLSVKTRKPGPAAPMALPSAVAVPASARRAAFTLRLDSERHLKLRLASAVTGMSAQQLVTAALDEFLTKIPEIDDLAGRVARSASR